MENINDNFIKLTENIDSNYKKIKNILIDDIHKLDNKIFNKTFIIILNYFKNNSSENSIKKCLNIIKYYLKFINNNYINQLIIEITNKMNSCISNKNIYIYLRSFLIICKKKNINKTNNNKTNNTYDGLTTKNTLDKDNIDNKIEYVLNNINNLTDCENDIKKLSIYIDRKKNDNNSKITYNTIINRINNILEKDYKNNIIESLLVIINKCKKYGNICNVDIESILYKCDNNIYDYIYILNKDNIINSSEQHIESGTPETENTLDSIKNNIIHFINKLGFQKKEFNDIDNLSLKRGFIFGLTKDNIDYILKYQPNKSTVELLINSYLKSLNISNSILIPELFFINNDNSYFYIIEKYNTDLYKYFNLLDEKKIILSFKELLNIIYFLINTISELHKNNIIHADLKLENIVLNIDNNSKYKDLKIIDFDVSVFNKIPNRLTDLPERYNKILNNKKPRGTRIYMLKDVDISFNNDIFSLGVIALVLLYKNTKLLLSYRKSIDSKNIIKKLTTFRNNIEDNKIKLDMINVIEKYLKKEHKKDNNKINNKDRFIDNNKDLIFFRDNDIEKFKIFKNFIDDCINNKLDIYELKNKYENLLFN